MLFDFDFSVDGRVGSNNQNDRLYIVNKGFYQRQQRERDTAKRGLYVMREFLVGYRKHNAKINLALIPC